MFGFELTELLLFGKQLGIALAGAAALWGFILSRKDFHCSKDQACVIYDWVAIRLLPLFLGGVGLGSLSYVGLLSTLEASAHVGIAYLPSAPEVVNSFPILTPLFILLLLICLVIMSTSNKGSNAFAQRITKLYAIGFALCFVITSFPAWRGVFDARQLFYAGHGFHSIFTLGSVLVLDYLFLLSKRANILKEHIFAIFPTISVVVWFGLAFDFLSSLFIIEGFQPTTKMLFMQTVIGILIVNGVMLSGPLARKMMASAEPGGKDLQGWWRTGANISGTVSAVSWLTITFVDSFENLPYTFLEYLGVYFAIIALAFAGHELLEWVEDRTAPPEFVHN